MSTRGSRKASAQQDKVAELSCAACNERKVRCDKGNPCSTCQATGVVCVPIQRKRLPRGRHVKENKENKEKENRENKELRGRLARLESLIASDHSSSSFPSSSSSSSSFKSISASISTSPTTPATPATTASPFRPASTSTPAFEPGPGNAFWTDLVDKVCETLKLPYARHLIRLLRLLLRLSPTSPSNISPSLPLLLSPIGGPMGEILTHFSILHSTAPSPIRHSTEITSTTTATTNMTHLIMASPSHSSIHISCNNALQPTCSASVSAATPKILSPTSMLPWLCGPPLPSARSFAKRTYIVLIQLSGFFIVPRLWGFCSMGNRISAIMTRILSSTWSGPQFSLLPLSA